jgi:hypothetical protein
MRLSPSAFCNRAPIRAQKSVGCATTWSNSTRRYALALAPAEFVREALKSLLAQAHLVGELFKAGAARGRIEARVQRGKAFFSGARPFDRLRANGSGIPGPSSPAEFAARFLR